MASSKLYYQNMYLGSNELSAIYHGDEKIWRVPFEPYDRQRPFMLYEPTARDFTANGFATIHPISAIHDRNFGQAGEVSIELPVDGYDEWKQVTPNTIILAPTKWRGEYKPQAFRVYRIVKAMDDSAQHLGIKNTRYRVQKMMSGTLDIKSAPDEGTTVTITIPK